MKYFVISVMTFIVILLLSKLFIAIDLVYFNNYNSKIKEVKEQKIIKIGKSLYLIYCASCHGTNGKGNNNKAQNHTQRISEKTVLDIINNGANNFKSVYPAGMPAGLVKGNEAKEISLYVSNGLKGKKPKAWSVCVSCHNENGEGIAFIAPNIKDYSNELVTTVLVNGKKGIIGTMPSFKGRLTDIQITSIASYIRSIEE